LIIPKAPRRVLETLAELQQNEHVTQLYPSHEYIASKLDYCRLTVIRAMKWLRLNKFITWIGRVAENGWCQTSNLYTILRTIPDDSNKIDEVPSEIKEDVNPAEPELKNVTRKIKHQTNKHKLNNNNCDRGKDTAQEFMQTWFDGGPATFQIIPETAQAKLRAEGDRKFQKTIFHGQINQLYPALKRFNDEGYSIHVAVNNTDFKGRRIENVTSINGFVLDLDGGSLHDVIEATRSHDFDPTMIVETSLGRYHVYWKSNGCPLDKWPGIQKTLANRLDGDECAMSVNKTLRMPGFNHLKCNPYPVRIIHSGGGEINAKRMEFLFPPPKPKPINRDFKPTGKMWDNVEYGESEGNRDEALFKFICKMEKFGLPQHEAEFEAIRYAQACTPPLPDNDAIRKVEYVWRRYR